MRIVAHLDMDAFFSAIEERDNLRFRNRPIVVGSDPQDGCGRGVVSTANYKARKYGIHSALPISLAWEYSQRAIRQGKEAVLFLGVDMERYEQVSLNIRKIVESFGYTFEQASVDEFYIDCTKCNSYKNAEELLKKIKKTILNKERLSCSVGIGPNKLVAKISSDIKKPNGFTVVQKEEVGSFLFLMSVSKIPGIGPKSVEALQKLNINTVGELQMASSEILEKKFGKSGIQMYEKSHGIDNEEVMEFHEIKSIGSQETFSSDTRDAKEIVSMVGKLISLTYERFLDSSFTSFSRVSISVRFSDFTTIQRSKTLSIPMSKKADLEFLALQMFSSFLDSRENKKRKAIRLMGIRLEKLNNQRDLFS